MSDQSAEPTEETTDVNAGLSARPDVAAHSDSVTCANCSTEQQVTVHDDSNPNAALVWECANCGARNQTEGLTPAQVAAIDSGGRMGDPTALSAEVQATLAPAEDATLVAHSDQAQSGEAAR